MEVKLKQFEGPLELLLQLIEQERLSITEIALAEVTDQYLSIISEQDIDAAKLADFLLIASRLLLIKSKTLLPFLRLSPEEEQEIKELTFSLQEYQRYKQQAEVIKRLCQGKHFCFGRSLWQGRGHYFYPPPPLALESLSRLYLQLLTGLEGFVSPREERVLAKGLTIEEKIKDIVSRIQDGAEKGLSQLAGQQAKKLDVILCFLAVLFLFRQKLVQLEQSSYEGELMIKPIANHG
jgi:segregation and condensation protein A